MAGEDLTYEKLNIANAADMAMAVIDIREFYKMDRLPRAAVTR